MGLGLGECIKFMGGILGRKYATVVTWLARDHYSVGQWQFD